MKSCKLSATIAENRLQITPKMRFKHRLHGASIMHFSSHSPFVRQLVSHPHNYIWLVEISLMFFHISMQAMAIYRHQQQLGECL